MPKNMSCIDFTQSIHGASVAELLYMILLLVKLKYINPLPIFVESAK